MDKKLPPLNSVNPNQVVSFKTHTYWGVSDPKRFKELLEEATALVAPGSFLGDNLFTWSRNNSALEDQSFLKAWQENICNPADEAIVWRRYILACAAYHCLHINGDFVECGVYLGSGIKTVIDYLGGKEFPKTFWGYDTFDYNPVEGHAFAEQKPGLFQQVKQRFKDYPQVKLIPGLIPQSFEGNQPEKISFLHIDLNQLKAELDVLEHFFEKVESGGIIILDDYEWGAYRQQKIGESEWFDKLNYRIFPLPTGQGLVIKR
jgi:hypothetical protein